MAKSSLSGAAAEVSALEVLACAGTAGGGGAAAELGRGGCSTLGGDDESGAGGAPAGRGEASGESTPGALGAGSTAPSCAHADHGTADASKHAPAIDVARSHRDARSVGLAPAMRAHHTTAKGCRDTLDSRLRALIVRLLDRS